MGQRTVAVLIMSDGRDQYLKQSVLSLKGALLVSGDYPLVESWWIHDDSGDDRYRDKLRKCWPDIRVIGEGPRRGFGGAIQHAWQALNAPSGSQAPYVLHWEGDFTATEPIRLDGMTRILREVPYLAQVALRRQPVNPGEAAVCGDAGMRPAECEERWDARGCACRHGEPCGNTAWLEHRAYWTTNPGLYRASITLGGWPDGLESEGRFTRHLLDNGFPGPGRWIEPAAVRFGLLGELNDPPQIWHIGDQRIGLGY